jgi:hypothetical protein
MKAVDRLAEHREVKIRGEEHVLVRREHLDRSAGGELRLPGRALQQAQDVHGQEPTDFQDQLRVLNTGYGGVIV